MKSEPVEIRVGTLRVILDRLCGSEAIRKTMKELYADDMVKLEVLTRRHLRVTIHTTGEIIEIGK